MQTIANYPQGVYLARLHPALTNYVEQLSIELDDPSISTGLVLPPYKILPSPTVVMGFQYTGKLHLLQEGTAILLKPSGITGIQTTYRLFQSHPTTRSILVRFKPWGAAAFFDEPLSSLVDGSQALEDLLAPSIISVLQTQLFSTSDPLLLSTIIQDFLLKRLSITKRIPKPNLIAAMQTMIQNIPKNLQSISQRYGFSERTLERHFKTVIGVSPKTFTALARFQKTLQTTNPQIMLDQLGYYDQSHFIHEFKRFSGLSPQKLRQDTRF